MLGPQRFSVSSPNQALISRFIPASLKEQTVRYEPDNRARHRSWGDRSSTLQALAQQIVADHPDNTILLFTEGGKDVATLQEASACVRGIFQQPGWAQHIMERIRTAPVSVANSTGAAVQAPRGRPERRSKRAALTQDPDSEATASQPAPARQRRKLVPTFVMPPGSTEWYHRKLLTDPATYCVPLTDGCWALPDYSVHTGKVLAHSPVQVRYWLNNILPAVMTVLRIMHACAHAATSYLSSVQVSTTAEGMSCDCEVFRLLADSTAANKCLHTAYVESQSQSDQTSPINNFSPPGTVVPIRPSISATAQPFAYWINDSFVFTSPTSQSFRCSHQSHKSNCAHTEAVKAFMHTGAATTGADDDELDVWQVCYVPFCIDIYAYRGSVQRLPTCDCLFAVLCCCTTQRLSLIHI